MVPQSGPSAMGASSGVAKKAMIPPFGLMSPRHLPYEAMDQETQKCFRVGVVLTSAAWILDVRQVCSFLRPPGFPPGGVSCVEDIYLRDKLDVLRQNPGNRLRCKKAVVAFSKET